MHDPVRDLARIPLSLRWWHRALVPIVGSLIAGLILHLAGRALRSARAVDYMEAVIVGDGRIGFRALLQPVPENGSRWTRFNDVHIWTITRRHWEHRLLISRRNWLWGEE